MNATPYQRERIELARCLDEVTALERVDREACAWLQNKLSEEIFNLVAVGQFKRGKSSVINALLGEALLPVGVTPLTSVVTVIRYGATPAATIVLEAGERCEVGLERLADYVTEKGNPNNIKNVREALISHPSPWLESGVRLVDTPGIGSVYEHNSDVTRRYLPQADAVLFVASVDQPMSRVELDFLDGVRPYAAKIFCLLNKSDYLTPDEIHESVAFSRHVIEAALGVTAPIYPVSARAALEEKRCGEAGRILNSGFETFEQALRRFIKEDKAEVWVRSVAHNVLRILSRARLGIDLELTALAAPVEEIQANLDMFRIKRREALVARSDYEVLLESNVRALLKNEIETSLERFKQPEKERVSAFIEDWFHELKSVPSKKLQDTLEQRIVAEVRSAYDGWLAREEPTFARSFEAICRRFWSDIEETIDDLLSYSATLFNVQFEVPEAVSIWSSKSGFDYKFWHEPVGLLTLTSSMVLALPKVIGDRLVVTRMRKVAIDLVEMQAGRIRYDFEERLKKGRREFCRQLLTRIDTTIAGIESAIDSGLALRDRGEVQAGRRRAELRRWIESMASIEVRIKEMLCRRRSEGVG
jgi:GTP-binding protein EngB required for normal cell division